jgi:hypothetical protein
MVDYPVKNAPTCRNGVFRSESPHRLGETMSAREACHHAARQIVRRASSLNSGGEDSPFIEELAGDIDRLRPVRLGSNVGASDGNHVVQKTT